MFYLSPLPEEPNGYVNLSTSAQWVRWLRAILPEGLDQEVQRRLISNLKHILVGLELKAGLIIPHANRGAGHSILFEPYFNILIFEFCVGVFSVSEGIGSAIWLRENHFDGAAGNSIGYKRWKRSLVTAFDPDGDFALAPKIEIVKGIRDKLHQDRLGARENIDWHAFSYGEAFTPAILGIQCFLRKKAERVPEPTNLRYAQNAD